MTEIADLKPCPFCGGGRAFPIPANRKSTERLYPIVRCMGCYTDVPGKNDDFSIDCRTAVAAWNTRPLDAKDKRIETLEAHKRAQAEDIMTLGKEIGAMAVALAQCADILDANDFGHDVRFQARELSTRYLPAPPSRSLLNKEEENG